MNKILTIVLVLLGFMSCAEDAPREVIESESESGGNIYGIVTIKETAEPVRATGVELYRRYNGLLVAKTVTYDDGHYEFDNIQPMDYILNVVASGYDNVRHIIYVESGKTTRTDIQLSRLNTGMTVRTLDAAESGGNRAAINGTYSSYKLTEGGFVYSTSPSLSSGGATIMSAVCSNIK